MSEFRSGDPVTPKGKLKKVVDFLATADKETLRILSSFFDGEDADAIADAKKLQKTRPVTNVYKDTLEVSLLRNEYFFEEKKEYWEKDGGESAEVAESNPVSRTPDRARAAKTVQAD